MLPTREKERIQDYSLLILYPIYLERKRCINPDTKKEALIEEELEAGTQTDSEPPLDNPLTL
jgi:hypothetical protein